MGRPRKNIIGRGEVTPTQVAFIVDRYLCDNRFFKTRALFRSEASYLIPKSSYRQVPSSLMTLDDMLNDYVALKQQKRTLEQERVRLDQENFRVQNLLHGMQNVINTYNVSFITPPPPALAPTYQLNNYSVPSSGFTQYYNTPNVMSTSVPENKGVDSENLSTPLTSQSEPGKQKVPQVSVRVDSENVPISSTTSQSESGKQKVSEVSVRVDCENVSTPSTSQSVPGKRKVPEVSVEAPPVTRKPHITTAQENSTANDLVSTSPSVSEPEIDLFIMDFDVEYVDETFSISELFNFDIDHSPMETGSLPPPESWIGNPERDQFISDHTSTVAETTQGKDMSTQGLCFDASFAGADAKTAANSVTK